MGQSTNAILVFGIDLNASEYCEEGETPPFILEEDDGDFDAVLLRDAGLAPWGYHEDESKCEPYDDYKKRREQAEEQAGVELVTHCSGDYPMYVLAVRGTEIRVGRGNIEIVTIEQLNDVAQDRVQKFRAFCERHDIPWSEPTWILCSYWG